jgi:hypothetical protein
MIAETASGAELLRIKSVSVEGLFGLYDHTIPLHLDERVTIIHGPNGVGKTRILAMLDALLRLDLRSFDNLPFDRLALALTNGAAFSVTRKELGMPRLHPDSDLDLVYADSDGARRVHGTRWPLDDGWITALVGRLAVGLVDAEQLARRWESSLAAHALSVAPDALSERLRMFLAAANERL